MEIFAPAESEEQRANPHPWAVDDVETGALVGFAMISNNPPQPMDEDLIGPHYLWKLHIDHSSRARATAQRPSTLSWTTSLRDPVLMCSIQAALTALARRAASTCGTASLIPVATCGARTSWHSTSSHRLSNPNRLDLPARHRLRFTVDLGRVRVFRGTPAASWVQVGLFALPVYGLLTAYATLEPQPDQVSDPEGWARFVSSSSYLVGHVLGDVAGTVLVIFGTFALGAYLTASQAPRLGLLGNGARR